MLNFLVMLCAKNDQNRPMFHEVIQTKNKSDTFFETQCN